MSSLVSDLKIGHKIGAGFFGEVFLGDDPVHGEVAIKLIKKLPSHSKDDWTALKASLLKEAQNLKKATHGNVVAVYHLSKQDSDDGILYVMQYCDGGCLQKSFEQGPMTLRDVRKVSTDIALGLSALHSRQMLHRDIKPSNILRDKNVYKLGDFGLVTDKLILGYASGAGYSDHLAPEVWATGATSVKTDIWAFGMTLYRLLHGRVWYAAAPAPATLIKAGGFADTLKWLPHIPKKWRRAIRGMLRDDPNDRYQNADQVLNALAALPVIPDWECEVSASSVRWRREKSSRVINVEWTWSSPKQHEWKAWSSPLGRGQNKTLAGSKGMKGRPTVLKELEAFFSAQI